MIHGDVVDRVLRSKLAAPSVPLAVRWLWCVFLVRCDRETGEMLMPTFRLAAEAAMTEQDANTGLSWLLGNGADRARIETCEGRDGSESGWRVLGWPELRNALENDIVKAKTRHRVGKLREARKEAKKKSAASFVPPTVEEVRAKLAERKIPVEVIDPEHFVASYARVGWVDKNRVPLTDWNAAITTWVKQHEKSKRAAGLPPTEPVRPLTKDEEFQRTHGGYLPRQWIQLPIEKRREIDANAKGGL